MVSHPLLFIPHLLIDRLSPVNVGHFHDPAGFTKHFEKLKVSCLANEA